MADFDLSMVATFDASSVASGSKQVEDGIERMSAAEFRALQTTKQSADAQRQAASAEKQRSDSLARILALVDPNAAGQARLNKSLAEASTLYKAGAISAAQFAQVQKLAAQGISTAGRTAGAAQADFKNLGFQISDITQSLALGINPFVVFGQQAGQTAAAVSGMGGVLGRVGSFLAGPFGSILLGAITVVGLLGTSLLDTGDAAGELEFATNSLGDAQSILGNVMDITTGKITNQTGALFALAKAQLLVAQVEARSRQAEARRGVLAIQDRESSFSGGMGGGFSFKKRERDARDVVSAGVLSGNLDPTAALDRLENLRIAGALTEDQFVAAATSVANLGVEIQNLKVLEQSTRLLNGNGTAADRASILRKGKSPRAKKERAGNKDAERLGEFGEKAEEKIKRINEAFDETPKLIDKAAQATRELDDIIADLTKKKPPNFAELIKSAQAAKVVVEESLGRPFQELLENSEKRMNLERLIGAGREDEARALEIIYQLQERVGDVTQEQRERVLQLVRDERELNEVLAQRKELTDAYLQTTQTVRQEIESILSGRGGNIVKTLQNAFKDIQGKILTEKLFGPILRDLDKFVKEENGLEAAVDIMATETTRAGSSAKNFADAVDQATGRISAAALGAGEGGFTSPIAAGVVGAAGAAGSSSEQALEDASGEIIALGRIIEKSSLGLSPEDYFKRLTSDLTSPLLDGLDKALGVKFFSGLQGVLSGVLYGLATAGKPGAVLGGLKGLNDKFGKDVFGADFAGKIGDALGKGLGGAQTGTQIAGVAKGLGFKKFSTTGSQIGGAIGSALPIPGGEIIGSIIGGTIGGLLKKAKFGTAVVGGAGDPGISGNNKAFKDTAKSLGGSVQDALKNIVQSLDAELGSFLVSIGTVDGKARVSTTGRTGKLSKKNKDVKDFGKEGEEAALAFAIQTAIGQGAIKGISEAMQKALKSSPDIDKAVKEALAVRDLEDLISGLSDLERAFKNLDKVATERVRLAKTYGLDLLAVEKVNADERKKLLDRAIQDQVGSLRDLLNDLSFGDLFEGTAVDRRQKILNEIADAEEDITAGVEGAVDRYADLQRRLVETSKEAFGTAGDEFGSDRSSAISNAERIIKIENDRIAAAAALQAATTAEIVKNNELTNETNGLISIGNMSLSTISAQLAELKLSTTIANPAGVRRDAKVSF